MKWEWDFHVVVFSEGLNFLAEMGCALLRDWIFWLKCVVPQGLYFVSKLWKNFCILSWYNFVQVQSQTTPGFLLQYWKCKWRVLQQRALMTWLPRVYTLGVRHIPCETERDIAFSRSCDQGKSQKSVNKIIECFPDLNIEGVRHCRCTPARIPRDIHSDWFCSCKLRISWSEWILLPCFDLATL